MYHIILCDDDIRFLNYMKNTILASGMEEEDVSFYEFISGEELANALIDIEDCDLCILDMQMKEMDGDAAARIFRRVFPRAMLVFCSGVYAPTTKSFETEPFRYLLKSYENERMLEEMRIITERMKETKKRPVIVTKSPEGILKLKPDQILYIEICKRVSKVYLHPDVAGEEKSVIVKEKLSSLYQQLKNCGFAYAHSSYIVNTDYVKELRYSEIKLIDGTLLSVSRSKEKEFRRAYIKGLDKY